MANLFWKGLYSKTTRQILNCGLFAVLFAISIVHKLDICACDQVVVECFQKWLVLYFCTRPLASRYLFRVEKKYIQENLGELFREKERQGYKYPSIDCQRHVMTICPSANPSVPFQVAMVSSIMEDTTEIPDKNQPALSTHLLQMTSRHNLSSFIDLTI